MPPKVLLSRPFPPNLKTVPSCKSCNNDASPDEQYFLILLSHAALSPNIESKLAHGGQIDRTLSYSPKLENRLLSALGVDDETGKPFIKPEIHRVNRVVRKMATGLYTLRYGCLPTSDEIGRVELYPYTLEDLRPLPYFIATFTERFKTKKWQKIQSGTFSYIFVSDPQNSRNLWCIMDIYQSFWGIVHFSKPKRAKFRASQQLKLF
ncbi:MAG: hypothetical protein SFU55_05910 [Methylophilus sp.]|nr:hypothetical protein [Methylophilus sp.]